MSWMKRVLEGRGAVASAKSTIVATPPSDTSTASVIELAKALMAHLREHAPDFDRGFYRAVVEPQAHGANASYVVGEQATLIDTLRERALFEHMRQISWALVGQLGKKQGVVLLVVDKSLDYEIKFDWDDLERWKITKMHGGTGIPAGL